MANGLARSSPNAVHAADLDIVGRARARNGNAFRIIMKMHIISASIALPVASGATTAKPRTSFRLFQRLYASRWLSRRFDVRRLPFPHLIKEALERLRKLRRAGRFAATDDPGQRAEIIPFPLNASTGADNGAKADIAAGRTSDGQPSGRLPTVFVARVIEGLNSAEGRSPAGGRDNLT